MRESKYFKEKWKNQVKNTMKLIDENLLSDEELDLYLDGVFQKAIQKKECDCKVVIVNNMNDTKKVMDFSVLLDFIIKEKPITTESGVLFYKHEQKHNEQANMLAFLQDTRKVEKNLKFEEQKKENPDTHLINLHETNQKAYKVIANSYYGILAERNSIFFNLFAAESITAKGRSIISTAFSTFENFLGNSIYFENFNSLLVFIRNIKKEKTDKELKHYITDNISRKKIYKYLLSKLTFVPSKTECELLKVILKNIKKKSTLNKLYYKNNIYELISRNKNIQNLYLKMINIKESFKNANKPPKDIQENLNLFWNICYEYVFYKAITHNKINKLRNDKRNVVLGCDTDSNFLNIGTMTDYICDLFNKDSNDEELIFKIVNITAYVLSKVIAEAYALYTKNCNVPKEYRWLISMKNEFLWSRVLFTEGKKNYASVIKLQEGVLVNDEIEIKGLQIKKSNVNEQVSKYLKEILENDILKSKEINTSNILSKLETLEYQIKDSFKQYKTQFSTPASVKTSADYKFPFRVAAYKGVIMWNQIFPENPIQLPNNVNIIKLRGSTLEDIKVIYNDYPDIYRKIKTNIFENPDLSSYGFEIIAIPKICKQIPKWLIPLIDTDTIIKDNVSVFSPILNSIGLKTLSIGSSKFFSNILEI